MDNITRGTALKLLIHGKGITIKQLAADQGLSISTLEGYTSGRRDIYNASVSLVASIADGLGFTIDELILKIKKMSDSE